MTLDDSILGLRLRVIRRAQAAGVSVVGREVGISRTVFYRWRKRLERYGPRRPASAPPPRPAGPAGAAGTRGRAADRERRAQCRDLGCGRIAADLAHRWTLRVAPSTVQTYWPATSVCAASGEPLAPAPPPTCPRGAAWWALGQVIRQRLQYYWSPSHQLSSP